MLDERSHPTAALASPALASLQGPALLCYNDAQFSEVDFQSIQRIGDSLKKEESRGAKTGRFGVGFNRCVMYKWSLKDPGGQVSR